MRKFSICHTGVSWLWVAVIVLALDRVTKYMATQYLIPYEAFPVMPGFNFTLSFNKGAAFSFLNSAPGWQVWFFGMIAVAVSVGILLWLFRLSRRDWWVCVALTLIIGGAMGNLWDRINYGQVIDFIQWYVADYYWPTFNIADSAICIGAVMLFGNAFVNKEASS